MKLMSARLAVSAAGLMVFVGAARGDISFTFTQGDLAAQVTFDQVGTDLIVTLENISTFDVMAPEQILTAVYFDIPDVTLTPVRAVLSDGSVVRWPVSGDGTDSSGEVGGEYGFLDGLTTVPSDASMVISAVGLDDLIGPGLLFPGEGLWGPPSEAPDGLGYGLLSLGDDQTTGNGMVTGDVPLVDYGVVFTLSLSESFDLESNDWRVMFNYGTEFNPIPAPGALVLGAIGLWSIGLIRRRFAQ